VDLKLVQADLAGEAMTALEPNPVVVAQVMVM